MITVAGEALMDVLVDPTGKVTALPGGAPFNVARTIARLGGDCQFLGRLSDDSFGRRLRTSLEQQNVRLAVPRTTQAPTTLAIAELDDSGSADYRFYLDETAASQLEPGDIPPDVFQSCDAIALGGLGILIEPTASSLLGLLPHTPPHIPVLLDPNCRPRAIKDSAHYRAAVAEFLDHSDVVKVSADDLRCLDPHHDLRTAARSFLAGRPSVVLVTDGAAPVLIHTAATECSVPVPEVDVVDTVGAGDAFVAAFLTWWSNQSLAREDLASTESLIQATAAAVQVAAAACTVRGANLPAGFCWSGALPEPAWHVAVNPYRASPSLYLHLE